MRKALYGLLAAATLLMASGCGEREPVKLGFISGQTGPFSDLGKAGLNGAVLAVEERNAKGGLRGRPVTLLIGDDDHDVEKARGGLKKLVAAGAVAIVGPMTSSMATAMAEVADQAGVVLMGGTVVTDQLTGKDDSFLRAIAPTKYYAAYSAKVHQQHFKPVRITVVYDAANRDYAGNWAKNYAAEFGHLAETTTSIIEIDSRTAPNMGVIGNQIMADKPDLVTFATSARTAASLMRTLRSKDERVRFAVSAWAANHLLPELAGSAAEEALTEQYHDLFDQSPAYTHFAARYQERFQQRPDYAGVIAYEATNLVLDGLTIDPNRASLKTTLLKKANFDGLQGSIVLDRDGDATRQGYTAIIKGGQYAPLN